MEMILPIFIFVATASACLGWWLGKQAPQRVKIFGLIGFLVLGVGSIWFHNFQWWPESLYHPAMVWADAVWFVPPALMLLMLLMRHHRKRENNLALPNPDPACMREHRAGVSLWNIPFRYWAAFMIWASGCILFLLIFKLDGLQHGSAWVKQAERRDLSHFKADAPFLLQSTHITCGPASAANLIRLVGVDTRASEIEMAELGMMEYHGGEEGGSGGLGLAIGLKRKAASNGYHVKILAPSLEELQRLRKPMICCVRYWLGRGNESVGHIVVLCATDPVYGVLLLDPLTGYRWEKWGQFEDSYRNSVVILYKDDLNEPSMPVPAELSVAPWK